MLSDLRLYFVSVLQNISVSISVSLNEIIYIYVSISVSVNEYNAGAYYMACVTKEKETHSSHYNIWK